MTIASVFGNGKKRVVLDDRIKAENKTDPMPAETKRHDTPDGISPPEVNEKGKPTRRAVESYEQAHSICKRLLEKAKDGRIRNAAFVMEKYNSSNPYDAEKLAAANEGWRSNFSTGFMASVVDRTNPQFLDPIKRAERITYSKLPPDVEGADEKSKQFQVATTKLIRSWGEWNEFLASLSQENTLHGNAAPGWIDSDWRPMMFGYDEALLPEDSSNLAIKTQLVVYIQKMLLHEFVEKLSDPEAMQAAQYDLEGCRKAANYAAGMGQDRADETDLERESRVREMGGLMGAGYTERVKTVNMYHLMVRDYSGVVDVWTTQQENGYHIRNVEGLHESMDLATALFTIQVGSKKFYGSKGIGRSICNIHIAVERNRCFSMDQVYLAGMLVIKAKTEDLNTVRPRIRHPFIIVGNDIEVIENAAVQFNAEAFEMLDNKLVAIAESITGAFIPPNIDQQGSSKTKIEAAQKAERELAVKQGVLGRFFSQFALLVSAMQKKIYNAENLAEAVRIHTERQKMKQSGIKLVQTKVWKLLKAIKAQLTNVAEEPTTRIADPEAVECIVSLLEKGLLPEEIAYLANEPASDSVQDNNEARDEMAVQFLTQEVQNPHIDQKASTEVRSEIVLGKDRAERVLMKDQEDPTVTAIAMRQQISEFGDMMAGYAVPVAVTDKHKVHRDQLNQLTQPMMQAMQNGGSTPEQIQAMSLCLDHYQAHIELDQNMTPEMKEQELQQVEQFRQQLQETATAMEQAAAAAQAEPGTVPPELGGTPVTPQDEIAARAQEHAEMMDTRRQDHAEQMSAADLQLRAEAQEREQGRKDAELELKTQRQDADLTAAEIGQRQDAAKLVLDEAARTRDQAAKEADAERRAQQQQP